ncbi:MAG: PH domain-containing protein [Gemmatimonadetes bacterium]|nr:PH domain-containing protein [Gemmatimonadota bacterium]MYG23571.1 PH domain-containing protein [Gemmatimonadota bacterium]MYJ38810.1 PH domain-containing protein [Gemmatimonadota bacterium]
MTGTSCTGPACCGGRCGRSPSIGSSTQRPTARRSTAASAWPTCPSSPLAEGGTRSVASAGRRPNACAPTSRRVSRPRVTGGRTPISVNQPDFGVWRRTSPFAIVFFLGTTIRTIARSYIQLVASFGAIAYLTRFDFASRGGSVGLAILLILFAIGGVALLRYWFFRFRIEDDRVLIRQGFIKRTALDLPFDRVQGINVERSLVDRMLGLVTVRLDTAGTIVAEGRLPAVGTELADWLRTRVDRNRRAGRAARRAGEDDPDQPGDRDPAEALDQARITAETPAAADQLLLRLTGADMLRIGLADRKALVLAGALAALAQVAEPFQDMIVGIVDAVWSGITGLAAVAQVIAVLVLFLSIALVLVTAVVIGAFLRHYDYTLWRRGTAFRSRGGLLTQKGVVVETAKIQQLTLAQNLILRWFGRFRFSALPAGAVQMPGSEGPANVEFAENLTVPLLEGSTAESLRGQVFGREATEITLLPGSPRFVRVSPYYIRAVTLRMCVVPIVAGTFFLLLRGTPATILSLPFGAYCLAAATAASLVALQSWRRRGYLHDAEGLASRKGFLGARVDAFLFRKSQGVSVKQSPLQRRRGLATLEVQLSSGVVTVPYVELDTAHTLRDYILYKVESSPLRWH